MIVLSRTLSRLSPGLAMQAIVTSVKSTQLLTTLLFCLILVAYWPARNSNSCSWTSSVNNWSCAWLIWSITSQNISLLWSKSQQKIHMRSVHLSDDASRRITMSMLSVLLVEWKLLEVHVLDFANTNACANANRSVLLWKIAKETYYQKDRKKRWTNSLFWSLWCGFGTPSFPHSNNKSVRYFKTCACCFVPCEFVENDVSFW